MNCPYQNSCGGCPLRKTAPSLYQQQKEAAFKNTLRAIRQDNINFSKTIFIADGMRRRAELTFRSNKAGFSFGFNAAQTHDIINIDCCMALTKKINDLLPAIKSFLQGLCQIQSTKKIKNKLITTRIQNGDIFITAADNGIDILLETNEELSLQHRMYISEFAAKNSNVIRISVKHRQIAQAETILEKVPPMIIIGTNNIRIPSGTFLQVSGAGETALIDTVLQYIGDTKGNIVDLFCGLGTFSYPLAKHLQNKICAVDSSGESLDYFQKNINALMLHNISIKQRNLFKYPLDENELKGVNIVIFDPPRAGAQAQVKKIAGINFADKPQKIVAVSCNPHTFINDANCLIAGGYKIRNITLVDQFIYTNHMELVALFEKN